jgi:hypothetical protein
MVHLRSSEEKCKHPGGTSIPLKDCKFEYVLSPAGYAPDKDRFYGIIKSLPIRLMSIEHEKGPITSPEGWHDYNPLEFIVRKVDDQLELHPQNDEIGSIDFNGAVPKLFSNAYASAFILDVKDKNVKDKYERIREVVLYLRNYLK